MNWLSNFIRPKIRSLVSSQKEVPDNLWTKCHACEGMLFQRDLKERLHVCNHCGHHLRWPVAQRLEALFDQGRFEELALPRVPADPLKFKDRKRYLDRIRDAREETGRQDALVIGVGQVMGHGLVVAAFDFDFMGGSMGTAVGEGIVLAAQEAVRRKLPLLVVPGSGGARMQEGILSLMQMPRTIIAVQMVREAHLPYLVLLTDPTTGGVSASFAMVGDIHMAEPGATIGFAGKRVIQETIREALPQGFQTAEYLVQHGVVDCVVPRPEQRATIARFLDLLTVPDKSGRQLRPHGGYQGPAGPRGAGAVDSAARAAGTVAQRTTELPFGRVAAPMRKAANG